MKLCTRIFMLLLVCFVLNLRGTLPKAIAAAVDPVNTMSSEDRAELKRYVNDEVNRVLRPNFMRLYRNLWQSMGMTDALNQAVEKAVADQTKDLMWGTAGLQLVVNNKNIIEDIQNAAAFNFAHDYDEFMAALETNWNVVIAEDIRTFYAGTVSRFLKLETNAMIQAWLRRDYERIRGEQGTAMIEALNSRLRDRHPELAATASLGVTAGLAGLAGILLRKRLTSFIINRLGGRLTGKVVAGVIPIVNSIMLAWGAYDIAAVAWDAEGTVRQELLEVNQELYTTKVPEAYWTEMEPYVKEIFLDACEELQNRVEIVRKIGENPQVSELTQSMNELERQEFAERVVAVLREVSGGLSTNLRPDDELLRDFGKYIRNASPSDFQRLLSILKNWDHRYILSWFALAGDTECYDLYSNLPPGAWDNFPPTEESLRLLTWIVRSLTPGVRAIACELDPASIQWIIDELPSRYLSRLFGKIGTGTTTIEATSRIEAEIERLSLITDKNSREPWMSRWSYFKARNGAKLWVLSLACVLLFVFRAKRKDRKVTVIPSEPEPSSLPLELESTTASPAASPFRYTVQLRVKHEFIRDLFDIPEANVQRLPSGSLTVTPSVFDEFTVYFNNLDALSRWILDHQRQYPDSIRIADKADDANTLRAALYDLEQQKV